MWDSWWTKRGLGRFFSGFLPFPLSKISFLSVIPCGFRGGRNGIWVGFLGVSHVSPIKNFIPLGHSMWVSWWTKWDLGRFSRGFSRFPYQKFHSSRSFLVGFVVDNMKSGQVFLGVSFVFSYHKFHSSISPHSSHSFHFIFISSTPVMVQQAWLAGILIIEGLYLQYRGYIISHSLTRSFARYKLSIFLLSSDIRSEGSKKIRLQFFLWFFILHHFHGLKMCFRKNVCVCVCVSVCLCDLRRT